MEILKYKEPWSFISKWKRNRKEFKNSFLLVLKVAENGDIDAQYNLAQYYEEKNLEKAFYWYQKTAENGNNNAQNNLGFSYQNGEETEKNLEKAFYWYQKVDGNRTKFFHRGRTRHLMLCFQLH